MPLSLMPPNGVSDKARPMWLIETMPASRPLLMAWALRLDPVKA